MDFSNVVFLLNDSVIVGGQTDTETNSSTGEDADTTTDTEQPTGINPMIMILIWVGVIAIFYLLTIRPQRKREKKTQEMQSAIKVGDNVITAAGFFGKVMDIGEDCFIVEFGTNRGVRIPVRKTEILGIKSPNMTPVKQDVKEEKETKDANP